MISYSELCGNDKVCWKSVVLGMQSGRMYDRYDHYLHLASNWETCAVGQLDSSIKRKWLGSPENSELSELGCRFMIKFENQEWTRCMDVLTEIEKGTWV